MGVSIGPKIVTDGLVLYLDAGDINSYPGEPTTNLKSNPLIEDGTVGNYYDDYNSGWGATSRSKIESMIGPFGKMVNVYSQELLSATISYAIQGNQSNITNGGTNSVTLTSGVEYTISVYIKTSQNHSSENLIYMAGASGNSGLGSIQTTTEWTRISRSYTPTVTGVHSIRHYHYTVPVGFKAYHTAYQVEVKSYATQFVNGTRTSTNGLIDLISGNAANLTSNIVYDSSAKIRFNENTVGNADSGDSNWIEIVSQPHDIYNISFWAKPDAPYQDLYAGYYPTLFDFRNSAHSAVGYIQAGPWTGGAANETFHIWNGDGSMTYIKDTIYAEWHYFSWNWNGSLYDFYLDGVQITTYNGTNGDGGGANLISSVENIRIGNNHGTYSFRGYMDIIQIYNSQQTESSILKNFNNQKSRFGK